jgi:hypothetical protein
MTDLPHNEAKPAPSNPTSNQDHPHKHEETEDINSVQPNKYPESTQPRTYQQDNSQNHKVKQSLTRSELWMAIFTGVIAFATVTNVFITLGQWGVMSDQQVVMQRQLAQMESGSKQTDRMIEETSRIASFYAKNLERNIEFTKDSMATTRRDQRAWVQAGVNLIPKEIKAGSKLGFGITLTNSGRTPTRNMVTHANTSLLRKNEKFIPTYKPDDGGLPILIQPGVVMSLNSPGVEFSEDDLICIRAGDCVFRVFGKFTYKDIFNETHDGKFCRWLAQNLGAMINCNEYNESN